MKGVVHDIERCYVDAGLQIVKRQSLQLSSSKVSEFYQEHQGKFFFEGLVLAMISGLIVALLLEGEDAVAVVRKLNGNTDPSKADPGTIRREFRSAGGPFNTVHGSDSAESAIREIKIIFG